MPHKPAERLQKTLARLGLASRREAEEWIRAGRLTINGQVATLGARVTETDQIRLDGRLIRQRASQSHDIFVCHRSPGEDLRSGKRVHTSRDDDDGAAEPATDRTPLIERLPKVAGRRFIAISPMPHVDGGLELVTADGELAEKLQRSVRRLKSEFSVRVRGELNPVQLEQIQTGVLDRGTIEVESCEPTGGEGTNRWYVIVARGASGKDIRQLFERQGALVSRVLRVRLGTVALDRRLARGQFRRLTPQEVQALLVSAGIEPEAKSREPVKAVPRGRSAKRRKPVRRQR